MDFNEINHELKLWNAVTGCSPKSKGCKNCYAKPIAIKKMNEGIKKYENGFRFTTHPELLDQPLKVKKPSLFFVNSMADIFHEHVPEDFILKTFEVMNKAKLHKFLALTKRPENMLLINGKLNWTDNIIMGVTVEHNDYVYRADLLKQSGAKLKWLSLEPLLSQLVDLDLNGINWVVAGGECGYGSKRPMRVDWVRDIRDKCIIINIPFFFKQWGSLKNNPDKNDPTVTRSRGGRMLDGRTWEQNIF